jgi:2-aminoadipate transaminase
MNWKSRFAQRTALMQRSTVRDLLKLTAQPGMISFAGGLPAPELLPVAEVERATVAVLRAEGARALQYGETEGVGELRDWIAARYSTAKCTVKRENVMVVSGSQQALDLIGKVFLDAGDRVLVENPTYLAALLAWRPTGAEFTAVPSDAEGMCVEAPDDAVLASAKMLYIVPNFQNPQGTTLSRDRRQHLAERARRAGLPVIEDNPYGELRYSGTPLPHLLELDARNGSDGELRTSVIHLGTFSKVMAPGLRVGWIVAAAEVIDKLIEAKQAADLHTSTFCQLVALELARSGFLEQQIPRIIECYRERRDAMLAALEAHFPREATWTRPDGGMFLLASLAKAADAETVLQRALEQKVAFVPGVSFHVGGDGRNTMRLNFSNQTPERIREGIERLGKVL